MKLENIIEAASEILNVQDSAILKRCANLVLGNIAANYLDFVATQIFDVSGKRINYTQFDKNFLKVKSVKSGGCQVDYSLYVDFIEVPDGQVTVDYCFIPAFANESSEITMPGLGEQCLVYGVLTEYATINGMYNEAKVWGEKFENGFFGSNPKHKKIRLPRGR